MSTHLHIVCLDAPSLPDYGGAIDMFYKIKALAKTGKKIILHYFDYNPARGMDGLENDCLEIHCYSRKSFITSLPFTKPFIVQSRINQSLIKRLEQDDHPILLEGLHGAGMVPFIKNKSRIVIRMHNDEAAYYRHLAQTEKAFLKRIYFRWESRLLQKFQHGLSKEIKLAALADTDAQRLTGFYGFKQVSLVPCFVPWQQVQSITGRGTFCLYHGNMQVSENEEAAAWLIRNVFSMLRIPFIIAGKGISKEIFKLVAGHPHIQLINDPSISQIAGLVKQAHIHVLPSMNKTGVKLKLLNALLNGRYCVTNGAGVEGSGLEQQVYTEDAPNAWCEQIKNLMETDFTAASVADRDAVLRLYNNAANAAALNALW